MLTAPRHWLAIGGFVGAAAGGASAQDVGGEPTHVETRMDAEDLRGVSVGAGPFLVAALGGEAFQELSGGWGVAGALGTTFGSGHAVRIGVARTRYSDGLASGPARSSSVTLQTLWRWSPSPSSGIEAGPTLGYARLTRDFYDRHTGGLVVGALVAVMRALSERVELRGEAGAEWIQFRSPTITGGPGDLDGEALGFRMRFGIAGAYVF